MTVATPSAIAEAGSSLVAFLEHELVGRLTPRSIVLGPPEDSPTKEPVVAVELVDVFENPHLRNGQWTDGSDDPLVDPAALVLDLRYRITVHPAHGAGDPRGTTSARHDVVGHVMHALHQGSVIRDPHLQGSLAGGPPLQVALDQQDRTPDHKALAVDTPVLHYLLTPVIIDPPDSSAGDDSSPGFTDRIGDIIDRGPIHERVPAIRLPDALARRSDTDPSESRAARSPPNESTRKS